jgi:hypothetical protein
MEAVRTNDNVEEAEITPEMIEAGRSAYYSIPRYRGDEPINEAAIAAIFSGMVRVLRDHR